MFQEISTSHKWQSENTSQRASSHCHQPCVNRLNQVPDMPEKGNLTRFMVSSSWADQLSGPNMLQMVAFCGLSQICKWFCVAVWVKCANGSVLQFGLKMQTVLFCNAGSDRGPLMKGVVQAGTYFLIHETVHISLFLVARTYFVMHEIMARSFALFSCGQWSVLRWQLADHWILKYF